MLRNRPFADVTQFMLRQAVLPRADIAFDFDGGGELLELLRDEALRSALLE